MKKIYLLFLLTFFCAAAFAQFSYYPISVAPPYGGVPQSVCVGASNTATTVTFNNCGTPTSGSTLTVTPRWYLNNVLVYTGTPIVTVPTSGTATLPAGVITFGTAGTFSGINGLRCDLVWGPTSPIVCGGQTSVTGTPVTVTVNANPAAITGINTVCPSGTTTLADATPGGTWSSSATSIATVNSSGVVSGIVAGTATITYSISGCFTTRIVTVNALPTAFSVTGGGSYCSGGSGMPVGLSSSASGVNYQLYNGSTATGAPLAGTGASLNFGLQLVGTYTVRATSASTGCVNGMTGSAVVSLATPVVPSVSISTSSPLICAGTINTFTANPVNGGTTPSYQWLINGISSGASSTLAYMPTDGDIVRVILTAAGGICASPDTASSSMTLTVTSSAMPSVSITATPGSHVCQGNTVLFSATSTFGGTTPLYKWNKNGINVATGPNYFYLPVNGDVVYCQLKSNYACRLADSVTSSSVVMTVETPAPAPTVSIIANPGLNIAVGQTDTLIAIAAGGSGSFTYQWMINAVPVPGATSAMFINSTFANNDIATCKVSNTDFCALSTSKNVTISVGTVGVENATAKGSIHLYPNPNDGTFYLSGSLNETGDAQVEVYNLLGQSVYSGKLNIQSGVIDSKISLAGVAPGMYILNVRTSSANSTFRFSVSK